MATVNFCLPFFSRHGFFSFPIKSKLAACYLVFAFPRLSLLPQKERYFLLINLSIKVDTKMTQWGKMFFWNRILIFLHILWNMPWNIQKLKVFRKIYFVKLQSHYYKNVILEIIWPHREPTYAEGKIDDILTLTIIYVA